MTDIFGLLGKHGMHAFGMADPEQMAYSKGGLLATAATIFGLTQASTRAMNMREEPTLAGKMQNTL